MVNCRKCGVELIEGRNWWACAAKDYNYVCMHCGTAYNRERYAEHRAERLEYARQYYAEHQAERLEYHRQYRAGHRAERREQTRQWAKANADKRRAGKHRRRAHKRGAITELVDEAAIYERDKCCVYCGTTEDLGLDHIVPLAKGGPHCEDNLVVACCSCNASKGAKPLIQWLWVRPLIWGQRGAG